MKKNTEVAKEDLLPYQIGHIAILKSNSNLQYLRLSKDSLLDLERLSIVRAYMDPGIGWKHWRVK